MDLQGIQTLFEITPSNLAEKQYQELIKYTKQVLTDVIKNIDEEKFNYPLIYSPSGDCMGSDNHYIPFYAWKSDEPADLQEVFDKLKELKQQIRKSNTNEKTNEGRRLYWGAK